MGKDLVADHRQAKAGAEALDRNVQLAVEVRCRHGCLDLDGSWFGDLVAERRRSLELVRLKNRRAGSNPEQRGKKGTHGYAALRDQ